mgnify:CR=1
MPATRIPGQNLLESLPPAERPQEAVSQLRDIAAWLRDEDMGEIEIADDADRLADDLARRLRVR